MILFELVVCLPGMLPVRKTSVRRTKLIRGEGGGGGGGGGWSEKMIVSYKWYNVIEFIEFLKDLRFIKPTFG